MKRNLLIRPPFFEIGPKNYIFGKDVVDLAKIAKEASIKYDVRVIYTTPYLNIAEVAKAVSDIYVFAPHMDAIPIGRGLAYILPESVKAAGAVGVMLNHAEKPLTLSELNKTLNRARELGLLTIACADTMAETAAIATLAPDLMISEPTELIGTGKAAGVDYVKKAMEAVNSVNPNIGLLVGGGISNGRDVYNVIFAGADATGSSSGILKAEDPGAMVHEMLAAVRQAWDDRLGMSSSKYRCE